MRVQSVRKNYSKHNGHMIKCLLTELGWAGQENIWLLVRTHGPRAKYLTSLLALPLSQKVHFSVLFIIYYIYFIITSTIWWGAQQSRLQFKCVLTENPPSPGKVGHTTAVYVPTLFEQWCGFFYVPQEQISESAVRWDLRLFVHIWEDWKV